MLTSEGPIRTFGDALGVDLAQQRRTPPADGESSKIGDDWSVATEHRFRAEERGFIDDLEGRRKLKRDR